MADFKVITSDFVKLFISTSRDDISFTEKRFPKNLTIWELKEKLELMTGASCNTMKIEIYDSNNTLICVLNDNDALLGSYRVDDGMRLHVIDKFVLRNDADVEGAKFEFSEEDYKKKSNTVRAFLLRNKLGHYNEEYNKKKEETLEYEKNLAENTPIGSRCKVVVQNSCCKLGTVMYAGEVKTLSGYWIGVKYDEPLGKNNGVFKGIKYFDCPDNYGAFVKPQNVECGDFPEEDYDLDKEI